MRAIRPNEPPSRNREPVSPGIGEIENPDRPENLEAWGPV
jgi:hypothetical protein